MNVTEVSLLVVFEGGEECESVFADNSSNREPKMNYKNESLLNFLSKSLIHFPHVCLTNAPASQFILYHLSSHLELVLSVHRKIVLLMACN